MNKLLIITSRTEQTVAWKEREQYVRDFCNTVELQMAKTQVFYTTYSDLEYTVKGGSVTIYDTFNQLNLSDISLVHFKNWEYNIHEAPVVASYLKSINIPFYNSEVLLIWAPAKLAQMVQLAECNIPVPDTFYAGKSRLVERFTKDELPTGFNFPLIMKANYGSRGDDNYLINNSQEALKILSSTDTSTEFVLQSYVPNDGDFRILFIGLDTEPVVFHRKGAEGTHLNNTSKGGTGTIIDVKDFPAEYLDYARQAAKVLHREIGGVDILVNKDTKDVYVLEVNGTPAIATGFGVDRKLKKFADFIEGEINT